MALQMALKPCVRACRARAGVLGAECGEGTWVPASSGPGGITTGTRGSRHLPSPNLPPALCPPELNYALLTL